MSFGVETLVTLQCPYCKGKLDTLELRVVEGSRGGMLCPRCSQTVHFVQPYPLLRFTASFLISGSIVAMVGVKNLFALAVAALILWVPVSLLLNAYLVHSLPLRLKPWQAPAPAKSLFEALNEKNATLEIFNKRPGADSDSVTRQTRDEN